MTTVVVHKGPKLTLWGALQWRLVPPNEKPVKALRRFATEGAHASALLLRGQAVEGTGSRPRTVAGLFVSFDGSKPPRHSHSLAAAFCAWTAQHPAALLFVSLPGNKVAVVAAVGGLPVLDLVDDAPTNAFNRARTWLGENPAASVFADDERLFPNAHQYEGLLESISAAASAASAIRSIPVNYAQLLLILSVGVAAIGGYLYVHQRNAEAQRQEALRKAQADDPSPRYLEALAAAKRNVGVEREALIAAHAAADALRLDLPGWQMRRIECGLADPGAGGGKSTASGCHVELSRGTGTYAGLERALPGLKLTRRSTIALNEAQLSWTQALPTIGLAPTALPRLAEFATGREASLMQDWAVAGLAIQLSAPVLWPRVTGLPPQFSHSAALQQGDIVVSSIALPQLDEVIRNAPSNIAWRSWSISVGDARQPAMERARATLKGVFYVRPN